MKKFILCALFGLGVGGAFSGEIGLKLKDLSITADRAVGTNDHWTVPAGERKHGELNMRLELSDYQEYYFIRTEVDSMYTNVQFRYVSLTQELAVEPRKRGVEFFIKHRSEHCLDCEYRTDGDWRYPNQNSVGVRFKFVSN